MAEKVDGTDDSAAGCAGGEEEEERALGSPDEACSLHPADSRAAAASACFSVPTRKWYAKNAASSPASTGGGGGEWEKGPGTVLAALALAFAAAASAAALLTAAACLFLKKSGSSRRAGRADEGEEEEEEEEESNAPQEAGKAARGGGTGRMPKRREPNRGSGEEANFSVAAAALAARSVEGSKARSSSVGLFLSAEKWREEEGVSAKKWVQEKTVPFFSLSHSLLPPPPPLRLAFLTFLSQQPSSPSASIARR